MPNNKEIQERITQELKPDISFENFCENHGVEYINQRKVRKKSSMCKKILIPISVATAVALCIGLPFAFRDNPSDNGIILYGDTDVSFSVIQPEELPKDSALLAFDLNKSESYLEIKRTYPTAKADLTVAYTIKEVLYGFEYEEVLYAYEFDYVVRCYEWYNFSDIDQYKNLSEIVKDDGIEFKYSLEASYKDNVAYISFEKSGYDYFINLRGYEDITEINIDSVEVFIRNVF